MKSAYIILKFANIDEDIDIDEDDFFVPEPFIVGVFSKKSIANQTAYELSQRDKDHFYAVEPYELNMVYVETQEEADAQVSECIEQMVKDGIVDYKIGEDGQFYFEVIDKDKRKNI